MEYEDIKLIKNAYEKCNIEISENLINKTIARCTKAPGQMGLCPYMAGKKRRNFFRYVAVFISIVVMAVLIIHISSYRNLCKSSDEFFKRGNCKSSGCNYKTSIVLKNTGNSYDYNNEIDYNELISLSEQIVLCQVDEHVSYINNGIPATIYFMKVIESYYGDLSKGDIFKLERSGGYFKFNELKDNVLINIPDLVSYADPELCIEILSDGNSRNFRKEDVFLLFIYKNDNGNYSTVEMNNGIFLLQNDYIRNFYNNESVPMPFNEFLNMLNGKHQPEKQ